MLFRNTQDMLPVLEEDPSDTSHVADMYKNTLPPPKHLTLRYWWYLLMGFLVFAVIFILTSLCVLYYFKVDLKTFIANTKKDVHDMSTEPPQPSATPLPTKGTWSTYKNTIHSYSILYPSDWVIQEDTNESIILYPPGSFAYAELTQADRGAGLGPRLFISVLTRPFIVPDYQHTTFTANTIVGYAYTAEGGSSGFSTIDFPINNATNILEFSLHNIGQEDIDQHLKSHKSDLVVQDIPMETFNDIAKSLKFIGK